MNKQNKFVDWLCGKSNDFPFFQDLKEVKAPESFEDLSYEERSLADIDINQDGNYNIA